MKNWTIGIVNYKTSVYMKWQFKCLFEFNDPKEFNLVIVDNSCDEAEFAALQELAWPYNAIHDNIVLIKHTPVEKAASGQHGEGLSLILEQHADSKYILFQDPDFFWIKQGILAWLQNFLEQGMIAVGAPYPNKMGLGHPHFPCAYGCVHRVSDIKHLDCTADLSEDAWKKSLEQFPLNKGWDFSYDVGYKLRQHLSSPERDDNFISFKQQVAFEWQRLVGTHSFETVMREYSYGGRIIAYHLFRGSFTGTVNKNKEDPKLVVANEWIKVRDVYGSLFYKALCRNHSLNMWEINPRGLVWAVAWTLPELLFLFFPLCVLYPLKYLVRPATWFLTRVRNFRAYIVNRFRTNLIYVAFCKKYKMSIDRKLIRAPE